MRCKMRWCDAKGGSLVPQFNNKFPSPAHLYANDDKRRQECQKLQQPTQKTFQLSTINIHKASCAQEEIFRRKEISLFPRKSFTV